MGTDWTIERLTKIKDLDFAITILNERRNRLTNIYSPLSQKLGETISSLNHSILIKNIDVKLLRKQRNYLLKQHKPGTNKIIEGLVNMLDNMLDVAEGFD